MFEHALTSCFLTSEIADEIADEITVEMQSNFGWFYDNCRTALCDVSGIN